MAELNNIGEQADLFKLFVGQIPKDMDELSLRPYFDEFGPIVEVSIIRDNMTMMSKGCAFVTYSYEHSAQMAVDKLHDKVQLPNSMNPLQVRFAETQVDRDNKLFIGMLPKTMIEQDLHDMFSIYGELREVHVIRGPEGGAKGCAFVKFIEREAALAAIENLNDTIPPGATRPLVVKFADGKKANKEDPWGQMSMFRQGGGPMGGMPQQRMMYPYGQPPMGMQQHGHGAGYHGQHTAPPSVVPRYGGYPSQGGASYYPGGPEGGEPKRSPYGAHPDALLGKPPSGEGDFSGAARSDAYESGLDVLPPPPMQGQGQQPYPVDSESSHVRPPEGPSGANLFIYHLPRDLTDADLATLFAPFGNVISAKVFVDKKTSDSKGFGFVSYDTLENANSAIESMNGFQIGSKRLKVQHKRVMGGPHTSGMPQQGPYGGMGGMMHQSAPMHMSHHGGPAYGSMQQSPPQQSGYYRPSSQGMMMAPAPVLQQAPQAYNSAPGMGMMQGGGGGGYPQQMHMRTSLPPQQQMGMGQGRMQPAAPSPGRGYTYPSYQAALPTYAPVGQPQQQQQQRPGMMLPSRGQDMPYGGPVQSVGYNLSEPQPLSPQQQQLGGQAQQLGGMSYMDQSGGAGKPSQPPTSSAGYYSQY